ncbi:MAG: hypothetical protein FJ403_03190 [Verrucomicrobia bacterium]|nr:hypothetical protein [Verrucomicrobiota bacterium]
MIILKWTACLLAMLVLSGCSTTITTNLTPSKHVRNANGLYLFEVALDSNQQTLRKETIKPYVVIGFDKYPMVPAPVLKNRWETLVGPIPADRTHVNYRYKFDYEYNRFPQRGSSSKLSPPYQLEIIDKQ